MGGDELVQQTIGTMRSAVERELTRTPFTVAAREGTATATNEAVTLTVPDSLTPAAAFEGNQLKPFSLFVAVPSTENTEGFRGRSTIEGAEQVVVTVAYKIRPNNQRASRDEAERLEEDIRRRIMLLRGPLRYYRPTFVGAVRGVSEASAEWWISTQTFQFLRSVSVDE